MAHWLFKTDPENPSWQKVDIRAPEAISPVITRDELKRAPEFADMMLLR